MALFYFGSTARLRKAIAAHFSGRRAAEYAVTTYKQLGRKVGLSPQRVAQLVRGYISFYSPTAQRQFKRDLRLAYPREQFPDSPSSIVVNGVTYTTDASARVVQAAIRRGTKIVCFASTDGNHVAKAFTFPRTAIVENLIPWFWR